VIVQPDVVDVALNTNVVAVVSPVVGTERMFHFPATSASEIAAGAAGTASVEDAMAAEVSAVAAWSFLAQPTSAAAQMQNAIRVACGVSMYFPG
jgi:hypothetical protein